MSPRGRWAWLLCVAACCGSAGRGQAKAGQALNSFAGPFTAYVNDMLDCGSDGTTLLVLRPGHFNPLRPSDKQLLTGNWTVMKEIDDSYWARVRMDVRSNNQWKENAFIFNFPRGACSAWRTNIPDFFHKMLKLGPHAENPKTPCRIPPGVYRIDKEQVDWRFPNVPIMPYGRYRYTLLGGKASERRVCLVSDCQITPKLD